MGDGFTVCPVSENVPDQRRACYGHCVEPTLRIFDSLAEADRADATYHASLSPQERLDLLLEIVHRHNEAFGAAAKRFERVHRIDELSRR